MKTTEQIITLQRRIAEPTEKQNELFKILTNVS